MKTNTIKDIVQQSNRKDTKMKKYERALAKLISTYNLDPCQNVTRGSAHGNRGIPFDLRSRMYHWIVEIAGRGQIFAEATTIVDPKDFPPLVAFILHIDGTLDFYYYANDDDLYYYVPEDSDEPVPIYEGVNSVHGKITDDIVDFFVNSALYEDPFAHLFCGCNPSYILSVEKEADKFYPVTAVDMADL